MSKDEVDDATLIVVSIKDILKYSLFVQFVDDDGVLPIIEIKGAKEIHKSTIVSAE